MIEYLKASQSYKACVMLAIVKAVLVIILNFVATAFLVKNNWKSFQQCNNSTAGNCRNEIILSSLCVTNILFGLGILVDFGAFICGKESTVGFLLITFSLISSLFHISLLTFERFIAARFPFKYQILNAKYVLLSLVVVWGSSIGIATATRVRYNTFLLVLCVAVLCSNVVVVVTYAYVIYKTRYSSNRRRATTPCLTNSAAWYSTEQKELQNRVTTLCCVIVLIYITTTLPCVICYIIPKYGVYSTPFSGEVKEMVLFLLLIWRSMTDPLIYIFREHIHRVFAFILSMATTKSNCHGKNLLAEDDNDVMTRI